MMVSERDRRVLIGGAGVIALLLVFARGIPALRAWERETRDSAREMTQQAAQARASVRGLRAAVDSAEARRKRVAALAPALLDGDSRSSAAAALAGILSSAAARSGAKLGSVQVRPDTAADGTFARVTVQADATGDLAGLTGLLEYLERAPELLSVREISITQPDAGGPAERPESLRLQLTVQGLALPGSASSSPDSVAGSVESDTASEDAGDAAASTSRASGRSGGGR